MDKEMRKECKIGLNCTLIGGIVFTNLPSAGLTLPSNIQYKIKVTGSGDIERTKMLLPGFPGYKLPVPRPFEKQGELILTTNLAACVCVFVCAHNFTNFSPYALISSPNVPKILFA